MRGVQYLSILLKSAFNCYVGCRDISSYEVIAFSTHSEPEASTFIIVTSHVTSILFSCELFHQFLPSCSSNVDSCKTWELCYLHILILKTCIQSLSSLNNRLNAKNHGIVHYGEDTTSITACFTLHYWTPESDKHFIVMCRFSSFFIYQKEVFD